MDMLKHYQKNILNMNFFIFVVSEITATAIATTLQTRVRNAIAIKGIQLLNNFIPTSQSLVKVLELSQSLLSEVVRVSWSVKAGALEKENKVNGFQV